MINSIIKSIVRPLLTVRLHSEALNTGLPVRSYGGLQPLNHWSDRIRLHWPSIVWSELSLPIKTDD